MYKCKRCKTKVNNQSHMCTVGKHSYMVAYRPNIAKPNKQSNIVGYMKHFGSKSNHERKLSNDGREQKETQE